MLNKLEIGRWTFVADATELKALAKAGYIVMLTGNVVKRVK